MEITRKNVLAKVGITPIETTQELQKNMQQQKGEVIALGLLSAFETGVIVAMGIMSRRPKLKSGVRYIEPSGTASEDFYEEEEV